MMYREFLRRNRNDGISYDVGYHEAWDRLRLTVEEKGYEKQAYIEVFLGPYDAARLATALNQAATSFCLRPQDGA